MLVEILTSWVISSKSLYSSGSQLSQFAIKSLNRSAVPKLKCRSRCITYRPYIKYKGLDLISKVSDSASLAVRGEGGAWEFAFMTISEVMPTKAVGQGTTPKNY